MSHGRRPALDPVAGDPARPWTHGVAELEDVRLHYVERGEGPLVLLLHGFPEFWYSWRYQIAFLADLGYRVVAPSMRGYGRSSGPDAVSAYRLRHLVADAAGLIDHLGERDADLVGHDWGGVVGWALASHRPDRVRRLVVVNAPHPARYRRTLRHPGQLLRSWYALAFQFPWLPELVLRAYDFELVERVLRREIRREDVLEETDFGAYAEALSEPGTARSMIRYYRAAARTALRHLGRVPPEDSAGVVEAETLVVWGEKDPWLSSRQVEGLEKWAPRLWIERLPDVGHFAHQEAHERVNQALRWFLDRQPPESRPAADGGGAGPNRSGRAG